MSTTRNLVPYGLLPNGNYGINLDADSRDPRAAALEILDNLPGVANVDNFQGRLVYSIFNATIFVFSESPSDHWVALEGVPATVGPSEPPITGTSPPVTGSEITGALYWTNDTEILFVWDSLQWQAAGGRYATTAVEILYEADGLTSSFPTGLSATTQNELIEVFIDGVRQVSVATDPGTGDYTIIGTFIVFDVDPVAGAEVVIRSFETVQLSQTAKVVENDPASRSANGIDTEFPTGVAGVDPASVFVYVDGAVQELGVDYTITQADTTIISITKGVPDTTATVLTNAPHGIPVLLPTPPAYITVELGGAVEPEYNSQFNIDSVTGANSFKVIVPDTYPTSATGDPTLFFSPPFIGDIVVFASPPTLGAVVYIKNLQNIVVAPSAGEANTLSLIPAIGTPATGRESIAAVKNGTALQVKGLVPGSNISIVPSIDGTDLEISAATGANFENRIGANSDLIAPGATVSYVGVTSTALVGPTIIVDLGISSLPSAGRKITIKDEGAGAGTRNIDIVSSGDLFEGLSKYTISTNRGSVTLVYDGIDEWHVTAEKI